MLSSPSLAQVPIQTSYNRFPTQSLYTVLVFLILVTLAHHYNIHFIIQIQQTTNINNISHINHQGSLAYVTIILSLILTLLGPNSFPQFLLIILSSFLKGSNHNVLLTLYFNDVMYNPTT